MSVKLILFKVDGVKWQVCLVSDWVHLKFGSKLWKIKRALDISLRMYIRESYDKK